VTPAAPPVALVPAPPAAVVPAWPVALVPAAPFGGGEVAEPLTPQASALVTMSQPTKTADPNESLGVRSA
jgi:hypothetical protein